ncbi:unnamed protein product [Protopolystoma xenopodis]|uniref:Uncharacterized protein n=1 Tax=Protopolystoma xenopodis TaxID=117903 RepID=A0A3S5C1D2_9PLAT|nr:unnamed protein product [Protopolystoma xenopodis]
MRVFENPKQPDKKIVSNHLDKLFHSIRLQMQFLVKMLLGRRWKDILDSLKEDERIKEKGPGAVDSESDIDIGMSYPVKTLVPTFAYSWH